MRTLHAVSFCENYLILLKGKKGDKIKLTMSILVQPESWDSIIPLGYYFKEVKKKNN